MWFELLTGFLEESRQQVRTVFTFSKPFEG